jgi:nucleotide-binding universal stress UspA family protein
MTILSRRHARPIAGAIGTGLEHRCADQDGATAELPETDGPDGPGRALRPPADVTDGRWVAGPPPAILGAKGHQPEVAMRILLALDGSAGADVARALVRSVAWPAGSQFHALRVIEPVIDPFAIPGVVADEALEASIELDAARSALADEVASLATDRLAVMAEVAIGRPATVILRAAQTEGADLIVMGSRGRGPIRAMVLGSVSAEVATHAGCPVLVARQPTARQAIIALDGTPVGDRILDTVATLPVLEGASLHVLCVAPSPLPGPGVLLSGSYGVPLTWYEDSVEAARRSLEQVATDGARRLAAAGVEADWAVLEGDPAAVIIDEAARREADLIVVGTHSRSGLTRLLLGSVARNVLLHADASVLVLHDVGAATTDQEPAAPVGAARV